MPERLGIPGFLRGRRYVALAGTPEYFTLYETVSRFTVTGAEYLARLNAPTPWTVATVKHFRNVSRSLCEVAASFGDGQGGLVATLRYDVAADRRRETIASGSRRNRFCSRLGATRAASPDAICSSPTRRRARSRRSRRKCARRRT